MAAPVDTTRTTPVGIRLEDGHSTKIAFARDPDVSFWEVEVQPPGLDGGDAINITTMHNTTWRTMAARQLKTLTECSINVAYDPNVYNNILDHLINQEGAITVHFPDGSKLSFFGYLKSFTPQGNQEGNMPTAAISIVPTNYDPVARTEQSPVLTSVSGT
jgi:hypothetical protein